MEMGYLQSIFRGSDQRYYTQFLSWDSKNEKWGGGGGGGGSWTMKVIHFSEQVQLVLRNDHLNKTGTRTRKPISQIRFCKRILIVENFNY